MTRLVRLKIILLLCLGVASCYAPISVHNIIPEQPLPIVVSEASLKAASKKPGKTPLIQAAATLDSLRIAHDRLAAGDASAAHEYNYLTGRLLEQLRASGVKPWQNEVAIESSRTRYIVRGGQPKDLDVEDREFVLTDGIKFSGAYALNNTNDNGVGAPLLAIIKGQPGEGESFDNRFHYRNVTAVVTFSKNRAVVEIIDPYVDEQVTIGNHHYPLHADFGANVSYALSTTRIDKLGLARLLNPERFNHTCRLSLLQPYDPDRIPVIMTHGLDSTPATWAPMYLALMNDERIREKYQFWVFSYSSGFPYPYSAALLRKELDRINRTYPKHKDMVLIGHSMGSLITRLMVTDVDDKLWISFFGKPPSETKLSGESRQLLEESLVFHSRDDVDLAIFYSGPHRGSSIATSWVGRMGAKLVRAPAFLADTRDAIVNVATADPSALVLDRAPNSIDTLAPNNRFILEINRYPIDKRIPFHSVIGDRGKGDTPNSSDGVVAYWSSHLDGAVSEKIVPSRHNSHQNPDGIDEARRILLEHMDLE